MTERNEALDPSPWTEAEAVTRIARQVPASVPVIADQVTEVYTPGHGWHTIDGEFLASTPRRQTGTLTVMTWGSFYDALTRYGWPDSAVFFAAGDDLSAVAVLNAPVDAANAGWGDHRLKYQPTVPAATKRWMAIDGAELDQQKFADFIEGNLATIASPDAAELLEIVTTLEASIGSQFRQSVRLADGSHQFAYSETVDTKAGGSGELTIPPLLGLSLALVEGEAPQIVGARLRFRIRSGSLTFCVLLDDLEQARRDLRQNFKDRLGGTYPVFDGTPWT